MITGTHFAYYQLCRRKLWLFANGINMEQESDLVYEGKLIHEESYPERSSKYEEVAIDGIKVDYYDAKNHVIRNAEDQGSDTYGCRQRGDQLDDKRDRVHHSEGRMSAAGEEGTLSQLQLFRFLLFRGA